MQQKFKKNAKQSAGRKQMSRPRRPRQQMVGLNSLDQTAMRWARLLRDPCYAPLTHPIYPGSEGGLLARFETEATYFNGATDTAGYIIFTPGALSTSVLSSGGLLNDTVTQTSGGTGSANVPGGVFLAANASSIRCVSACMQVSWPGSELDRQGYVTLGQATGAIANLTTTTLTSVASLRPLCHLRCRVPTDMAEVRWRPTQGDGEWTNPSAGISGVEYNKKGSLICTVGNLKAAVGIRIRFIATYEWQPLANQGMATSFADNAKSKNTLDDVANFLDKAGPDWGYTVGTVAGQAASMYAAFNVAKNAGRAASGHLQGF